MTTVLLESPSAAAEAPEETLAPADLYRLSVEQYHRMIEAEVLVSGDPIELLHGMLVRKMTISPGHRFLVELIRARLAALLPTDRHVMSQQAITLADSEPEPDVAVVRGALLDFRKRHPAPHEVDLVVEVADATLRRDRRLKLPMYARAGIVEAWLASLSERLVEVFSAPQDGSYREVATFGVGQSVPFRLDGRELGTIAVADLFPEE